jgi:hypothetical protein
MDVAFGWARVGLGIATAPLYWLRVMRANLVGCDVRRLIHHEEDVTMWCDVVCLTLPDEALVVEPSVSLLEVDLDPVVQPHHLALLDLSDEDVLEARRVQRAPRAAVQLEPDVVELSLEVCGGGGGHALGRQVAVRVLHHL